MNTKVDQKEKILRILEILYRYSDDSHELSYHDILKRLEQYGIHTHRQNLYSDFKVLERMECVDIIKNKCGRETRFHIGNRLFEPAELKLLVDIVQSSRFITVNKSKMLIDKLCNLTSVYESVMLSSNVQVSDRIKSMNETIFINTDTIQDAILNGKRLRFKYFSWNVDKERQFHRDGNYYVVEPFVLVWNNTYYYLVAYDIKDCKKKHFRVDKMVRISALSEDSESADIDRNRITIFNQNMFEMYGGKLKRVRLRVPNELANVIIDRFGKDVDIIKRDDESFEVRVDVSVSNQFYGWVFGLGSVEIISPGDVREEYINRCRQSGQID